MGKKVHRVLFKHINGALKNIPGVLNKEDLAPKMTQVIEHVSGKERPVMKADMDHVAKIYLLDEDLDIRLTPKEEKLPKAVQERILARRAEEADFRIRANEMLRESIKSFENGGGLKVINWDDVVDEDSPDARGSVVNELSEIALADFADRGLEIPEYLKKASVSGATAEKNTMTVKQYPTKKKTLD